MYDERLRSEVLSALAAGATLSSVAKEFHIARSTAREWRDVPRTCRKDEFCPRCGDAPLNDASYAALLGFHLGDGCLSTHQGKVVLRVSCDKTYVAVITDVQRLIVDRRPAEFLRGLFHSDGSRFANPVRKRIGGELKTYLYPRWQFSNRSEDIHRLCGQALDCLGIAWRRSGQFHLSVSRREAVARLDALIGPKA